MNRLVVCMAVFVPMGGAWAEEKKPTPTPARIVLSGKPTGSAKWLTTQTKTMIENGKEVTVKEKKELTVIMFKLDDKTSLAVALPPIKSESAPKGDAAKGADPDLARLLKLATMEEDTAIEGTLSTTDDAIVIAMTGAKAAKRIPILIADRETPLNDSNKKKYPSLNSAQVEGVLIESQVKFGSESTHWAIQQEGVGHIPLMVSKDLTPPAAGNKVRVAGPARLVDGRFVVEAKQIQIVKKD